MTIETPQRETVERLTRTAPLFAPPAPPALPKPTHGKLRALLIGLEAFVAATALWGAIFVVPTIPQEWLRKGVITPFTDTTIPALALGVLCGGVALAAVVALLARPRLGALLAIASGVIMVGFEFVEILVVGFTPVMYPTQFPAWLQPLYILVGLVTALLGARLWRAYAEA